MITISIEIRAEPLGEGAQAGKGEGVASRLPRICLKPLRGESTKRKTAWHCL